MTEIVHTKDGDVELPRAWFEGATAPSDDAMTPLRAMGFAHFRRETLLLYQRLAGVQVAHRAIEPDPTQPVRMQKEFAPLYEGDRLIGQQVVYREFGATRYLPFIERVHPDDVQHMGLIPGGPPQPIKNARVQRFNLHKGRYVLEGTET